MAESPSVFWIPDSKEFPDYFGKAFAVYVANPAFLKSSEKDTAPPPEACLQLISRATEVFREYYILKQDLARRRFQRRVKLLCDQKKKQLEDLNCCREDRKSLRKMAERLS